MLGFLPEGAVQPTPIKETGADSVTVVCPGPDDFEFWNEETEVFDTLTANQRLRVTGIWVDLGSTTTPESGTVRLRQSSAGGTILWSADFDSHLAQTFGLESFGGLLLPQSTNAVVVCTGASIRVSCRVYQEPQ